MRAQAECKAIYDRLMRFATGQGRYPGTDEEWAPFESDKDPWGNNYFVDDESARMQVCSAGPDGIPATGDDICYPSPD